MAHNVVMIHGMWGGPWYFDRFRQRFEAAGHRCVTVTLPYHNVDPTAAPDPRIGTASLIDYADAIECQIKDIGGMPVILGHSMGGLLALMLGARGLASALILIAPAAPAGIFAIRPSVLRSFWSALTRWGFWRLPHRQTYAEAVYAMLEVVPEQERRAIYDRFVFESGRAAFEIGFWLLDYRRASHVDPDRITCPLLIQTGSKDRITPASVVRQVARRYRASATYKEYPEHAHWLMAEPGSEQVADDALQWLAKKQPQ